MSLTFKTFALHGRFPLYIMECIIVILLNSLGLVDQDFSSFDEHQW